MHSNGICKSICRCQRPDCESSIIADKKTSYSNYFNKQNELLNSWIRQQGHSEDLLPKIKKKRKFSKYLNVNGDSSDAKLPLIVQGKDKLLNIYHNKCIDEVFKHNEPRNRLNLIDDPKELVYLKKLPEIKMSVRGIGKTKDYTWEISNDLELAQLLTTGYSRYF